MPSDVGATCIGPPGNGMLEPLDKRSCWPLATAIAGAPALPNGMAPIQLQPLPKFTIGSAANEIVVSAGAGLNTGDSSARKCVNGWASSPGGALITVRLCR